MKNEVSGYPPVLFIGLPCEVAGLKAYLGELLGKEIYKNLITIDLICFGATSPKVAEEYTKNLKDTYQSKITDFSVRYKKDGKWTPAYLRAEFSNGKEYLKPFYETEYGRAFNLLPRPSCRNCRFKGEHHLSDITIGDFWGCSEQDSFWNPHGVSVLFVHTEKGLNCTSSADEVNLVESTYERAIEKNPMYLTARCDDERQQQFTENFAERGLNYACKKSMGMKEKAIGLAGEILPEGVKKGVVGIAKKLLK